MTSVTAGDPALSDGRTELDRPSRSRQAEGAAPQLVSIRHYDPARDFQAGVQSSRQIGAARADLQIDLPASVDAEMARGFADLQVLQRQRGLNSRSLALPTGPDAMRAGMALVDPAEAGALRVTEIEHFRGVTRITAREWSDQSLSVLTADPGRNQPGPDLLSGTTRLMLLDLPAFGTDDPGRPSLSIAAAGTGAGWRRAALSLIDGDRTIDLGGTNGVATMGILVGDLVSHTPMLVDRANTPVIRLLHDAASLPPGTGEPASFDAPSIWLGGEIIRYGSAEKIGARDYRLHNLMRGCFGTGDTVSPHAAGAECLLLEQDSLLPLAAMPAPIGAVLDIEALGTGDVEPVGSTLVVEGVAIMPRRPVHGRIERLENGDMLLGWVRRDRLNHDWADGADIPNSEGVAEYAVDLSIGGVTITSWAAMSESLHIAGADITALSLPLGSDLTFSVKQQGRYARSAPLLLQTML